ncbi:flavodoxin-dependent (E)-4-hydroxy-3-methylbut-2-enyl-diphosphate synthase [Candidatus Gracilibacteria bacterium]|nr:flavodoxin-dependent (E)-4-hydroxy-3-methylbut-2-enyl-diphosphate synthase [Candidatus Gracilibacteria bacterium]
MKSEIVKIGKVKIGGGLPVVIQSMTDTPTSDINATVKQCIELYDAGAEIVRMTVNDEASAKAIPEIKKILKKKGYENIALVGDFHFNGHILLNKYPLLAKTLDKYRINPANEKSFEEFVRIAIENDKPVRIGLNKGSFDGDIVKAILKYVEKAEKIGLKKNKIVLSLKSSDAVDFISDHERLISEMKKNRKIYALHVGLTEAGTGTQGIVSSSVATGILLKKGIGDTIRVSITPSKNDSRTKEVEVCKNILQTLNLRTFTPKITSCPGCGRTNKKYFLAMVEKINDHIKKYKKTKNLHVAIMGCIVNGPGECKKADIAIMLPGHQEKQTAQVYIKGKLTKSLNGKNMLKEFFEILDKELKIR